MRRPPCCATTGGASASPPGSRPARPRLVNPAAPPAPPSGGRGASSWPRPARSPAASPCARSPPPHASDDHRHVDQVLVILVTEEALPQLGQPVLPALRELLPPVAQQDVVVRALPDQRLVVVEVRTGPGASSSAAPPGSAARPRAPLRPAPEPAPSARRCASSLALRPTGW